jgi:selenide,water dikinase
MLKLNKIGTEFGTLPYVQAMTDVTGFGLLGHLLEMCAASGTKARIDFAKVPLLHAAAIEYYLDQRCVPGGTQRNFDSYGHKIAPLTERQRNILCDPQTSGGLLVAVTASEAKNFQNYCAERGYTLASIGEMIIGEGERLVEVC